MESRPLAFWTTPPPLHTHSGEWRPLIWKAEVLLPGQFIEGMLEDEGVLDKDALLCTNNLNPL